MLDALHYITEVECVSMSIFRAIFFSTSKLSLHSGHLTPLRHPIPASKMLREWQEKH